MALGVFQRLVFDLAEFAVVPQDFIDAGETVVVEGRYRGLMQATGTRVDARFAAFGIHLLRQGWPCYVRPGLHARVALRSAVLAQPEDAL